MAALPFRAVVSAYTALASGVASTILQLIATATTKVRVDSVEVSFPDTSTTDAPALVRILRQTTAIGGSPTTNNPVKVRNGDAGTLQTTGKKKASSGDSEPTGSDVYWSGYLHQQGRHLIPGPFVIEQSDRLGVEITPSAAINCGVTAVGEE